MNKNLVKVLTLLLSCLILIGVAVGITVAAEDNEPTVSIYKRTVSYGSTVQVMYSVDGDNAGDGNEVKMLFSESKITAEEGDDVDELGLTVKEWHETYTPADGAKTYLVFFSDGIYAKEYRMHLYAAAVVVDEDGVIKAIDTTAEADDEYLNANAKEADAYDTSFNPYDYAMARFDGESTEEQFRRDKSLLDYGGAVQAVLGYTNETVGDLGGWIDAYYNVTVDGDDYTGKRATEIETLLVADRLNRNFVGFFDGNTQVYEFGEDNTAAGWHEFTIRPGKHTYTVKYDETAEAPKYDTFEDTTALPSVLTESYFGSTGTRTSSIETDEYGNTYANFVQLGAKDNKSYQVAANQHSNYYKSISYEFDMRVNSAVNLQNDGYFIYLKYYTSISSATDSSGYTSSSLQFRDRNNGEYFDVSNKVNLNYKEWFHVNIVFVKNTDAVTFNVLVYVNGKLISNELNVGASTAPYLVFESRYSLNSDTQCSDVNYDLDNVRVTSDACADGEHTYGETVGKAAFVAAATCEVGTEYQKTCTACGAPEDGVTFKANDALGHKYEEEAIKEEASAGVTATCTVGGKYYYSCTRCGKVNNTDGAATFTTAGLGHDMAAATCTEPSTCKRNCGHTEGEALGHNIGNYPFVGVINTGATATSPATYFESCSRCGEKGEKIFPFGKVESYYGGTLTLPEGMTSANFNGNVVNGSTVKISERVASDEIAGVVNYFVRSEKKNNSASNDVRFKVAYVEGVTKYYVAFDFRWGGTTSQATPQVLYIKGMDGPTGTNEVFSASTPTSSEVGADLSFNGVIAPVGEWVRIEHELTYNPETGYWSQKLYVDGTLAYNIAKSQKTHTGDLYIKYESRWGNYDLYYDFDNVLCYYEHDCNTDAQLAVDAYKAADGNCTTKTTYYYACSICGAASDSTFETDYVHGTYREIVDEEYLVTSADCDSYAVYYKSCEKCGAAHATETFKDVDGGFKHSFNAEVPYAKYVRTNANENSPATYYMSCSVCGETDNNNYFVFGKAESYYGGTSTLPSGLASANNLTNNVVDGNNCKLSVRVASEAVNNVVNYFIKYKELNTTAQNNFTFSQNLVTDVTTYYFQHDFRWWGASDIRDTNWPLTIKLISTVSGEGAPTGSSTNGELHNGAFNLYAEEGDTTATIKSSGSSVVINNGEWVTLCYEMVRKEEAATGKYHWTVTLYINGESAGTVTTQYPTENVPNVRYEPRYTSTSGKNNNQEFDFDNVLCYYEHTCVFDQQVVGEAYRAGLKTFYKSCGVCGKASADATFETSEEDHVHVFERNAVLDDNSNLYRAATCTEEALYFKLCNHCDTPSNYDCDVISPDLVFVNGEALGHDMADATCTEPSTCKRNCGYTEGEALGHDMADATCTAPKTCSVCGATEGDANGHTWEDKILEDGSNHVAGTPSFTQKATYYKVCSVCAVLSTETFVDESSEVRKVYVLLDPDTGSLGTGEQAYSNLEVGKEITLTTPTLENYTFMGWYYGDTLVAAPDATVTWTIEAEEVTLTAKWAVSTTSGFNDKANLTGGTNSSSDFIPSGYDSSVVDQIGTQYVFKTTFTYHGLSSFLEGSGDGTSADSKLLPATDLEPNFVRFFGNNGSSVTSIIHYTNSTVGGDLVDAEGNVVAKDGVLLPDYINENGTAKIAPANIYFEHFEWYGITYEIADEYEVSITITMKGSGNKPTYQVVAKNLADGTVQTSSVYNADYAANNIRNFYWESRGGNSAGNAKGFTNKVSFTNITFTKYAVTTDKVTLDLDPDMGTLPESATTEWSVYPNTPMTYTLPTPTKENYKFLGWYDGDTLVESGVAHTISANTTLVAKWHTAWTKVTFDTDLHDQTIEPITYNYLSSYKLPVPTLEGYRLVGWKDESGSFFTSVGDAWNYDSFELKLTAVWAKVTTGTFYDFEEGSSTAGFGIGSTSAGSISNGQFVLNNTGWNSQVYFPVSSDKAVYSNNAAGTRYVFEMDFTYVGGANTSGDNHPAYIGFQNAANFSGYNNSQYANGDFLAFGTTAGEDGFATYVTMYGVTFDKGVTYKVRFEQVVGRDSYVNVYVNDVFVREHKYGSTQASVDPTQVVGFQFTFRRVGNFIFDNVYCGIETYPEKVTLDLDPDMGTLPESATTEWSVYPNAPMTYTLPTPTLEGYTFMGWYDGDTKVESGVAHAISKDTTLVAKWVIATTHNYTGSQPAADSTGKLDFVYTTNAAKAKVGTVYTFSTNYTYKGLSSFNVTDGVVAAQNASSSGYGYFRFYGSNGSAIDGAFGGGDYVKTSGSWVDANGNIVVDASGNLLKDYANLAATDIFFENITFIGGTFKINTTYKISITFSVNASGTVSATGIATDPQGNEQKLNLTAWKTAYSITRFNYEARSAGNAGVTSYALNHTFDDLKFDVVVPATKATLTLDPTAGSIDGELPTWSAYPNVPFNCQLPTPTLEGYEFLGWYNGDTLVESSESFTLSGDITLTAKWSKTMDVTITPSATDPSSVTGSNNYLKTDAVKTDVSGTKYIFTVDYTYNGLSSFEIVDGVVKELQGTDKYFGFYGFVSSTNVNQRLCYNTNIRGVAPFVNADGVEVTDADGKLFEEFVEIDPKQIYYKYFTWAGMTFERGEKYSVEAVLTMGTITVSADGTITASNPTATITATDKDGNVQTGELKGMENSSVAKYTCAGFSFFVRDKGSIGVTYFTLNQSYENAKMVTVVPVVSCDVSFDAGDGDAIDEVIQIITTESVPELPVPNRTNYDFLGWYMYDGKTLVEAGDFWNIDKDVTLVAKWRAALTNITFDAVLDGVTVDVQTINYGTENWTLPTPTKEGYEFIGWYDENGEEFASSGDVWTLDSVDLTLTAKWYVVSSSSATDFQGATIGANGAATIGPVTATNAKTDDTTTSGTWECLRTEEENTFLHVEKANSNSSNNVKIQNTVSDEDTIQVINFRFRINSAQAVDSDATMLFIKFINSTGANIKSSSTSDYAISYSVNSTGTSVGSFEVGTWYDVSVIINRSADNADVWNVALLVDGKTVTNYTVGSSTYSASDLAGIRFEPRYKYDLSMDIDDVTVTAKHLYVAPVAAE